MLEGIDLIQNWNGKIKTMDDYVTNTSGLQTLAATCMILESFGESCKKIDKLLPDFLLKYTPEYPWKELKGLRDVIAHGYFKIDAELILSIVKTDIDPLKSALQILLIHADEEI